MTDQSRNTLTPPPMRVCLKGWWINRDLSHAEAEAYHLREAAKLAGSPFISHQMKQQQHLEEARRNREWSGFHVPAPNRPASEPRAYLARGRDESLRTPGLMGFHNGGSSD